MTPGSARTGRSDLPVLLLWIAPGSAWPTPDFRRTLVLGIRQHERRARMRIRRASTSSQGTTVQLLGEWACPHRLVLAAVTAAFCPQVGTDG